LSPHWSRSDEQFDLWPWQRKQKKKEKRQWQTGYSPRPPTSPYRIQSLHAGWPPVCSSIFQVVLKLVQWFCLVMRKRKYDHITATLRDDLLWLPIRQRVMYKLCTIVYKMPTRSSSTIPVRTVYTSLHQRWTSFPAFSNI